MSHASLAFAAQVFESLRSHLADPSTNPCNLVTGMAGLCSVASWYNHNRSVRYARLVDSPADTSLIAGVRGVSDLLQIGSVRYLSSEVTLEQIGILTSPERWADFVR